MEFGNFDQSVIDLVEVKTFDIEVEVLKFPIENF